MPPKQVTCIICNEEVLKSKTFSYKDGRACKHHDGVKEYSLNKQSEERKTRHTNIEQLEEKKKPKEYVPIEKRMNVCWKCGCEGVDPREFYLQCAIAIEKMELVGEKFNPFIFDGKLREHIKKDCQTPIFTVFISDRKDVIGKIKYKNRSIASFVEYVILCPKCLNDLGLEEKLIPLTKIPSTVKLEDMLMLGTLMKPILQEEAINQLHDENFKGEIKEPKGYTY